MTLRITKRPLKPEEILEITADIRLFPDLAYLKPGLIESFTEVYVAEVDGIFAGFCAIESYNGVRKLGPIAVKVAFQRQGIGMELMRRILLESKGKRTYFGTSNQKLRQYGLSVGVLEFSNITKLPPDIRRAVIHFFFEYVSPRYLLEAVRKLIVYGRHKYTYFMLP